MRDFLFVLLFCFGCWSCQEETRSAPATGKDFSETGIPKPQRTYYKDLGAVVNEADIMRYWSSEGSYYPALHFFNPDTVTMEFNGQCEYRFPVKHRKDSLLVYWALQGNCKGDIGMKNTFDVADHPLVGKPFMVLLLRHDTSLIATYLHKEWAAYFNRPREGYPYLPDRFLSVGN